MTQLPAAFDQSQHGDMRGDFDVIPPEVCKDTLFLSQVSASDVKDTNAKDGKYIWLEITILEGDFKGRKIWTNLNIVNKNPVAVEIANKEFATICRACNKVGPIDDTVEIHEIPFLMKLKVVPAKGDYPAKNEPAGYEPLSGGGTAGGGSSLGDARGGGPPTGAAPWAYKGAE